MEDLNELYKSVAKCKRQEILWLILQLMKDEKVSYEEISMTYVEYVNMLKQGVTDTYMELRDKVIEMWVHPGKELVTNLKNTMHFLKNKGVVNISEEDINTKNFKL